MHEISNYPERNWFLWFGRFLIVVFVFLFLGRLIDLQIIRGAYFRELADKNRIRKIPISASRGLILDKNGEILVGNKDVKKFVRFSSDSGFKKEIYDPSLAEESEIISESERVYFLGSDFGHASGYLSETTKEEVGKVRPDCPEKGQRKVSQLIGRTGLEEYFECVLSGFDGEEIVEVDSMGRKVRTLGRKMPISGENINTNIDVFLQGLVSKYMQGKRGAVIATDQMGRVLAIYSAPSYDPNDFIKGDLDKIKLYFQDKNLPLFNRVISGIFHPGSVYKPLVGLAALSEGAIERDFKFNDEGVIIVDSAFGSFSYSNWYFTQHGGKEGLISLSRALARSTDTYFYKVGELLGVKKLEEWSKKFELDKKTGIELPGEIEGLV
ncbi:MAG: penicillin-binding transpeptidase domain-containing protein, partial [Patescibacteria group bacterium]|nr:penicillin-binding transpeptidase domain-containing protein [Patescibacteria group bacterium]